MNLFFSQIKSSEAPDRSYVGCEIGSFHIQLSLSADGVLACGSTDTNVYLWDVAGGEATTVRPMAALTGHVAEVTCLSWRHTPEGDASWRLASCADDDGLKHRLWEVNTTQEEEEEAGFVRGKAEMRKDGLNWPPYYSFVGGRCWSCPIQGDSKGCFFDLKAAKLRGRDLEVVKDTLPASPQKGKRGGGDRQRLSELPCSPRKFNVTPNKKKNAGTTPKKLAITPSRKTAAVRPTPTAGLPNLVRDGTSPRTPPPHSSTRVRRNVTSLLAWLGKENELDASNVGVGKCSKFTRGRKRKVPG